VEVSLEHLQRIAINMSGVKKDIPDLKVKKNIFEGIDAMHLEIVEKHLVLISYDSF